MKIAYITAILTIAIMILVSGCGEQATPAPQPSAPADGGTAPSAPTTGADEAVEGEAPVEPAAPAENVGKDVVGAGSGVTELGATGKFATNVGCTNEGVVSFTLTNTGKVPLILDQGQELTGSELAGKELLKVTFNGKPLRALNCGQQGVEYAPGATTSCTQNEGVTIRTTNPYGAPIYNKLQIRTYTGNQEVQLGACS